jgi:hypothetical protein
MPPRRFRCRRFAITLTPTPALTLALSPPHAAIAERRCRRHFISLSIIFIITLLPPPCRFITRHYYDITV